MNSTQVFVMVFGTLASIIGFFLVRTLNKIEKSSDTHSDRLSELGTKVLLLETALESTRAEVKKLSSEWKEFRGEVGTHAAYLRMSKDMFKEVAVLTRDRDAAFRRIDELRQSVKSRDADGDDV